jgi:hypothetical protein
MLSIPLEVMEEPHVVRYSEGQDFSWQSIKVGLELAIFVNWEPTKDGTFRLSFARIDLSRILAHAVCSSSNGKCPRHPFLAIGLADSYSLTSGRLARLEVI